MSDRVSIFMYLPRASTSDVNENELHGNACLQTLCKHDVNETISGINEIFKLFLNLLKITRLKSDILLISNLLLFNL